jgi:SAM-dependent methyltransferase
MLSTFSAESYEQLWQDLVDSHPEEVREYFRLHKTRYYELFGAIEHYLKDKSTPRLLEVGVSGFFPLYPKLFPDLRVVTIDRPVEMGGTGPDYSVAQWKAERHYNVDLNAHFLSNEWGTPALGLFDYVVCAEVLEHLIVNPVEFISSLLGLLEPKGYLYLTTPNFFSHGHLGQIEGREHPMPVYPKRGENKDHHHHFREYSLQELVESTKEAGGTVIKADYSDCWDDEGIQNRLLRDHPDQSSNLVVVAQARMAERGKRS